MKISNSKERLKEMMSALELKPVDICKRCGIQKSSLSNYINGTREPRQDQISLICDPFEIDPAWLMGYDVPMYRPKQMSYFVSDSRHDRGLSPVIESKEEIEIALELYEKYKNAIPQVREAVDALLKPVYIEKPERKVGKS